MTTSLRSHLRDDHIGLPLYCLLQDGIQPDLYWNDLGFALLPQCCHLLCGVLHALLALGISAGQACVLRHFPEVLLPCAR